MASSRRDDHRGGQLHHGNFGRRVWLPAVAAAGLPGIHLHDLRHAGNTLSADAGANPREPMERMHAAAVRCGGSSTRWLLRVCDLLVFAEPPVGIEPTTYSLRVTPYVQIDVG